LLGSFRNLINFLWFLADEKMDRDEVLVKLVEQESIIWKRNHPQFKNISLKEQAWSRVAFQLGISSESFFAQLQQHSNIS
jgi:Alcohol dehydrogenase transcription factor Myb/SANT-like